ncbi:M23 family metallopeptidase [Arthrobacter sp. UYCu723]
MGSLTAPLETLTPTSPFGLRISPLSGSAGEFHWGQDFAAPCGTRVYAADAGVVRAVGWHPWGGGNRVEVDHENGLITTYNHLQAIAVKKGESVEVGEVIAKVGTTGSSTGCHLHFETIRNGAHTNPLQWTLQPIKQRDELGNIEMISYVPGTNAPKGAPTWAIPVRQDNSHAVTGGNAEKVVPPPPEPPVTEPPRKAPPPPVVEPPVVPQPPPVVVEPPPPPVVEPPVTSPPPPVVEPPPPPVVEPPVISPPPPVEPPPPPVVEPPVISPPPPVVPQPPPVVVVPPPPPVQQPPVVPPPPPVVPQPPAEQPQNFAPTRAPEPAP